MKELTEQERLEVSTKFHDWDSEYRLDVPLKQVVSQALNGKSVSHLWQFDYNQGQAVYDKQDALHQMLNALQVRHYILENGTFGYTAVTNELWEE